jgi:two-component system CheB/CheR fusion protein
MSAFPESTEATAPPERYKVVGIGASAGGLAALEALLARLTVSGASYLVVQHQAPNESSSLVDILARSTPLRVLLAVDGTSLQADTIYVAPPALDIMLQAGSIRTCAPSGHALRDSIDVLFRSLAAHCGASAIGVVLSGTGADGTEGLRAIAAAGGLTFAQTPASAGSSGMPQSALDSGCVAFCLSPSDIGDELIRRSGQAPTVAPAAVRLNPDSVAAILGHLYGLFGVDFGAYKLPTVERRIERRMLQRHVDSVEHYAALIKVDSAEPRALYDDILISVTSFFRDAGPFDALISEVFPQLFDGRSPEVPVRFWVPATAGGEEAYSLAICLLEFLGPRAAGMDIQIFASDIDDAALRRARVGQYGANIEHDVSPDRLARFFVQVDGGYRVCSQVRDLVVFTHHNLAKDPPFSRLDLVTCRNVLIYMQPSLQQRVLRVFHYALRSGGFLLLGSSESVGDAADLYSSVNQKAKIYKKKDAYSLDGIPSAGRPRLPVVSGLLNVSRVPARLAATALEVADRKVLEHYGPPGVLVNAAFEVIQFRGQMGPFLDPMPGTATFNILKLIRPELLPELRSALMSVSTLDAPIESGAVAMQDGTVEVKIDVLPLHQDEPSQKLLLVLFRQAAAVSDTRSAGADSSGQASGPTAEARIKQLERELLATREFLETAVYDLRTSNEELQGANEELQSGNEELQSANEELETSKEELATMNEELHNRMGQLAASNFDLETMLQTGQSPVLLVGPDLRIRRYSRAAEQFFRLVPTDIGRRLSQVGGPAIADADGVGMEAIRLGRSKETRIKWTDGHWYTLRFTPDRVNDSGSRGLMLEVYCTSAVRPYGAVPDMQEIAGKVLSTLPEALALLDDQLRLIWVNKGFFDIFHVGAEILGLLLEQVWPGRKDHPDIWARILAVVAGGPAFRDIVAKHPLGSEGGQGMRYSARRVHADGERAPTTLLVIDANLSPESPP